MLSIEETIKDVTIHSQLKMAESFLDQLRNLYIDASLDEVDALGILDCLGVAGLSLTIGEYASRTFFTEVAKEKTLEEKI